MFFTFVLQVQFWYETVIYSTFSIPVEENIFSIIFLMSKEYQDLNLIKSIFNRWMTNGLKLNRARCFTKYIGHFTIEWWNWYWFKFKSQNKWNRIYLCGLAFLFSIFSNRFSFSLVDAARCLQYLLVKHRDCVENVKLRPLKIHLIISFLFEERKWKIKSIELTERRFSFWKIQNFYRFFSSSVALINSIMHLIV